MKKLSARLLQQQATEKAYQDFKAINGDKSWPFDAFSGGFHSGVLYQKTLVKNRAKLGRLQNKK